MEQHSSNRDSNKQVQTVQELLPSRQAIKSNETIIIDDDDDDIVDISCPDVSAIISKPTDCYIKPADKPSAKPDLKVTNQDHNIVSSKYQCNGDTATVCLFWTLLI